MEPCRYLPENVVEDVIVRFGSDGELISRIVPDCIHLVPGKLSVPYPTIGNHLVIQLTYASAVDYVLVHGQGKRRHQRIVPVYLGIATISLQQNFHHFLQSLVTHHRYGIVSTYIIQNRLEEFFQSVFLKHDAVQQKSVHLHD